MFVLIVFYVTAVSVPLQSTYKGVAMQEFSSQATCEAAGKLMKDSGYSVYCVPK